MYIYISIHEAPHSSTVRRTLSTVMASAAIARSFRRSLSSPSSTLSSPYSAISKRLFSSPKPSSSPPLPRFSRPIRQTVSPAQSVRFDSPYAAFRLNSSRCRSISSPLNSGGRLTPSFPGRNSQVRFYSVKEMTKKISFKDGNIMSNPKKTKFFKSRKGRLKGISYNDICFGKYALQALEPGRIKPRQIQAARREMSRIAGGRIWARKRPEFGNGWGRGSPAYYVPVVKPGRILYETGDGSENNQHIARTAGLIATWIQKDRAKENPPSPST